MKRYLVMTVGLSMLTAAVAGAQANTCPPGTLSNVGGVLVPDRSRASQDVCQMAVDVFQFMGPQLGVSLAGGNATMGQGGALGGLGHFSVGLRANVIKGDVPNFSSFPTPSDTGRIAYGRTTGYNSLPSKSQILGLPTVDAGIGLFQGIPLGLTNVLGIDGLLSATYVPKVSQSNFTLTPSQSLQFGYGVRIGVLQESILVPGVSFTYLKRDLPTTTMDGSSSNINVSVSDAKVNTSAWRLVASKSLILFGVAAGVGQDKYDQSAAITATVTGTQPTIPPSSFTTTATVPGTAQTMTRTNYFVDASLNLLILKLTGEIGQVSGGTVNTYNTFQSGRADKAQTYGSIGFRLGF